MLPPIQGRSEKHAWLNELASIPVLGHFGLMAIVIAPAPVLAICFASWSPWVEAHFEQLSWSVTILYNFVLWLSGLRIKLFWLPAWLVILVIGIFKSYFP